MHFQQYMQLKKKKKHIKLLMKLVIKLFANTNKVTVNRIIKLKLTFVPTEHFNFLKFVLRNILLLITMHSFILLIVKNVFHS